jgi:hypothetical protein
MVQGRQTRWLLRTGLAVYLPSLRRHIMIAPSIAPGDGHRPNGDPCFGPLKL